MLSELLVEAGVVNRDGVQARLHRRRFAEAKKAHPCRWEVSIHQTAEFVAALLAPFDAGELLAASRSVAAAARPTLSRLRLERKVRMYVCGGLAGPDLLSSVECYDFDVGAWEVAAPMLQVRGRASAAVLAGCLYVCGGTDRHKTLRSAERFDPVAGMWEAMAPMVQARKNASAVALAGKLFVCGGSDGAGRNTRSVECLDPWAHANSKRLEAVAWELGPPMLQERAATSAAVVRGCLYVCGGSDGHRALNTVERFDPSKRAVLGGLAPAWEAAPCMLQERGFAAAAVAGGRLFVCGGFDGQRALATVERFDPVASTNGLWCMGPPMRQERLNASAAVVCGRLLVCGGVDLNRVLASAEQLDPAAPRPLWEAITPMLHERAGASIAVVTSQTGTSDSARVAWVSRRHAGPG